MTNKFAVINPMTGLYTEASTEQERDTLLAQIAWDFFLSQTHNTPYSVVTINEDGSENWASPTGTPMKSPAQLEAEIAQWMAQQEEANQT